MDVALDQIAGEFLEISSEQRLAILTSLYKEKSNLSSIAKQLDSTAAEVHRNLGRLQKVGLVRKDTDGNYTLTTYGKTIHTQIPTLEFMVKNKKYFENHDFAGLSYKYIQRKGTLAGSDLISGYAKVLEKWQSIYKNAKQYIRNILVDIPYDEKTLGILKGKLEGKVEVSSIFSETAIVPDERRDLLSRYDFTEHIRAQTLRRKMTKKHKITLVLNENEAGISFPTLEGEPDMSRMFYSSDQSFHEWCNDLFAEEWSAAVSFQESKLARH